MFDQLVVSSLQRRKHTAAKYFFGTGALYLFAIACAFATSVLMSDPKLADTGSVVTFLSPTLPPALGNPWAKDSKPDASRAPAPRDPNHVQNLDQILSHRDKGAPPIRIDWVGSGNDMVDVGSDTPIGIGSVVGVINGRATAEPPPRPADLPKLRSASQATTPDDRPMRIPSSVLQGKAIERRKPIYPPLAQQIRLHGDVSVEVMIAPDGHVESARIVSGHPMLADKAREAALGWRFQPTLLNNLPVRVTGVIVFVFKLGE